MTAPRDTVQLCFLFCQFLYKLLVAELFAYLLCVYM